MERYVVSRWGQKQLTHTLSNYFIRNKNVSSYKKFLVQRHKSERPCLSGTLAVVRVQDKKFNFYLGFLSFFLLDNDSRIVKTFT